MAAYTYNQNKGVSPKSVTVYTIFSLYLFSFRGGNGACATEDRSYLHYMDEKSENSLIQTCRPGSSTAVNPYTEQWRHNVRPKSTIDLALHCHGIVVAEKPAEALALNLNENVDSNGNVISNLNQSLFEDLEEWKFASKKLLYDFPLDKQDRNFVHTVSGIVFSKVNPAPLSTEIKLAVFSEEVLVDILDLHPDIVQSEFFLAFVSGNTYLSNYEPLAHRYGGHQFGSWSGQLGDGRAHLLGEYVNRKGERWELQLKGSGLTPYSRRGDGRAVIRSSVREFLASEAMHHLGITTTRAASLVVSNDPVWRDQFYDGNPKKERAAVVLRIAPSWFRIGSFEILTKNNEFHLLRQLGDFIIDQYFLEAAILEGDDRFLQFYASVVSSTAKVVAQWMAVGFAHGVMNTDNFSILSLTIDYGPFGFLDEYDPGFVPNTSDDEGMYAIGNQATAAHFNLAKLREALLPLLSSEGILKSQRILAGFGDIYSNNLMGLFRKKLALEGDSETSNYLIALLLKMMEDTRSDYTMTFRELSEVPLSDLASLDIAGHHWALRDLQEAEGFTEWIHLYSGQFDAAEDRLRRQKMQAVNPRYILRNWMAQEVISEVEEDRFNGLQRLHRILKNPFTEQGEAESQGYASRPPAWSKKLKVSCSS